MSVRSHFFNDHFKLIGNADFVKAFFSSHFLITEIKYTSLEFFISIQFRKFTKQADYLKVFLPL